MAVLAAIISETRGAPVPAAELDALLAALAALRGDGAVRRMSPGPWAQVALVEGEAPGEVAEEEGGWHVAVGTPDVPVPLWRAGRDDLDGVFAAVRFDAGRDALEVVGDPFGLQALYVARRGERTYVCTSALALARHLRAPADPVGNALFLRTGVQYGPVTHWAGVERLEPGSLLRFTARRRELETYFLPTVDEDIRRASLQETVELLIETGRAAMRPLEAEGCLSADLTGGFDTRMLAAFLLDRGLPFTTHTTGDDHDLDVELAPHVARAGGFPWRHERLEPGWRLAPADLESAVAWGDGTLQVLQLAETLSYQADRRRRCPVVVGGVGGEHLSPFPWLQEFHRAGRTRTIHWENLVRMRLLLPMDVSVFREDPGVMAAAYARDVLGRRAALYADQPNTTRHDAIYAYRSPSHSGAYRSASEAHVRAHTPFHHRAFFSVGFSAHHRFRNGSRLHRGVISRLNPALAEIRTQRGGPASLVRWNTLPRFAPYYTRLLRSAARKVTRRAGAGHPTSPVLADAFRAAVQDLARRGVLAPASMRSGHLYRPERLAALVRQSAAPGFSDWAALGRVATLELALRAAAA
jgi:hypothetical protein